MQPDLRPRRRIALLVNPPQMIPQQVVKHTLPPGQSRAQSPIHRSAISLVCPGVAYDDLPRSLLTFHFIVIPAQAGILGAIARNSTLARRPFGI